jgi:F0F1-type ATP synthase membrane subunit b/b'
MRPMPVGLAMTFGPVMDAERTISTELAELSRREQMLRHAGEELLQEADLLRRKYEQIIAEVNRLRGDESSPGDQ